MLRTELLRPVTVVGARKSVAMASDLAVHNAPMLASNALPVTSSAGEHFLEVTPSLSRQKSDPCKPSSGSLGTLQESRVMKAH